MDIAQWKESEVLAESGSLEHSYPTFPRTSFRGVCIIQQPTYNTVSLEKLSVTQLTQKFPAVY